MVNRIVTSNPINDEPWNNLYRTLNTTPYLRFLNPVRWVSIKRSEGKPNNESVNCRDLEKWKYVLGYGGG